MTKKYLVFSTTAFASIMILTIALIQYDDAEDVQDEVTLTETAAVRSEPNKTGLIAESVDVSSPTGEPGENQENFDASLCHEGAVAFNVGLAAAGLGDVNSLNQAFVEMGAPIIVAPDGTSLPTAASEYFSSLSDEKLELLAEAGDPLAMIALSDRHLVSVDEELLIDESTFDLSFPLARKWSLEAAKNGKLYGLQSLHSSVQRLANNLSGAYGLAKEEESDEQSKLLGMLKKLEVEYVEVDLLHDLLIKKNGSLTSYEYSAEYLDSSAAESAVDRAKTQIGAFVATARDRNGIIYQTEWGEDASSGIITEEPKVNRTRHNPLSQAEEFEDTQELDVTSLLSEEKIEEYRLLNERFDKLSDFCRGSMLGH